MKVYIDFDNTVVDSVRAFVSRYNQVYTKKENPDSILTYDYSELKLQQDEIIRGFNSYFFFSELNMYPDVQECLHELKDNGCSLILVTRGTCTNISKKIEWLDKHHWFKDILDDIIFLTSNQDKLKIDMSNSILIDDYRLNHIHSNAKYKYAFKSNSKRTWYPSSEDGVQVFSSWRELTNNILKTLENLNKKKVSKSPVRKGSTNKVSNNTKNKYTRSNSSSNRKNNTKQKGGE